MKTMKVWLKLATPEERERLATGANTSVGYLYHLAADDDAPHARDAHPELARALEKAAAPITADSHGRLPLLLRTDLSSGCRGCEFAERCLGDKAVASEFRFLPKEG